MLYFQLNKSSDTPHETFVKLPFGDSSYNYLQQAGNKKAHKHWAYELY